MPVRRTRYCVERRACAAWRAASASATWPCEERAPPGRSGRCCWPSTRLDVAADDRGVGEPERRGRARSVAAETRTSWSPSAMAPTSLAMTSRSSAFWLSVASACSLPATVLRKLVVRSSSLMLRATTVAGVSKLNPWLFDCVRSPMHRAALGGDRAGRLVHGSLELNAVAPPRASIRISGSRCNHGRRKNASRTLSTTRRVKPSGSALVSAFSRRPTRRL